MLKHYLVIKRLPFLIPLLVLLSCSKANNWPEKIKNLPVGLEVTHTPDVVYASLNTKDPETRGKYQLQHTTRVTAVNEDLEIIEFGAYTLNEEKWELRTIYDRPFNKAEFIKWYKCDNGILKKGVSYSDADNWMGKTNHLNHADVFGLWYYIAKNNEGEKFVGAAEITGKFQLK